MAQHKDETGDSAIHEIMYVQSSDPGAKGANKFWLDTTGGASLTTGAVLKQRNGANSGWTTRCDLTALTVATASYGDNDTSPASTAFVQSALATIVADGNTGTSKTIDWSAGNIHTATLTGNCTFTFTAPSPAVGILVLKLAQDGTGSRTVTWPAAVHWPGGTAPTLTTTASKLDIFTFLYDGSVYYGVTSGLAYA